VITQKPDDHTPIRRVRVPKPLWDAYETVCKRAFSQERAARLLDHMRADIREHGTADELALLEQAEREMTERRARKGGRPRKEKADRTQTPAFPESGGGR
jgi:hypothetical protein